MTQYELRKKGEIEKDLKDASDKVQAASEAVGKKIKDPSKDLDTEYAIEKIKKKLN